MTEGTKKPKPPIPDQPESKRDGDFQFGDEQAESSWFRRAVAAGVKYTERTGLKMMAVLDLEEGSGGKGKEPFNPKLADKKAPQPAARKSRPEPKAPKAE